MYVNFGLVKRLLHLIFIKLGVGTDLISTAVAGGGKKVKKEKLVLASCSLLPVISISCLCTSESQTWSALGFV